MDQRDYFILMRDEVAKMVLAGKNLNQILKEFKVPQRFAHYAPRAGYPAFSGSSTTSFRSRALAGC